MRIKTFYSKTMSEAFREIKNHLGSDAILLSSKEIPCRSGVWGSSSGFEVVAACDDTENIDVFSARTECADTETRTCSSDLEFHEMVDGIVNYGTYSPANLVQKRPAGSIKTINTNNAPAGKTASRKAGKDAGRSLKQKVAAGVCRNLVDSGVDASLVKKLMSIAWEQLTPGQRRSRPALLRSIARTALTMMPKQPDHNGMPGKNVVAFIGPTGVGKTTSLAKLAAHLALKKKKKVILVTTDGYRIGAIDQLRTYAGLMGIPFRFVAQVPDLIHTIEENKQRDYILIDTAGRSPQDLGPMQPLADFLKQSSNIERHLVLSVSTNSRDIRNIMDTFEICGPDHLLFTKLDETSTPGSILNEIIRTQKSFSYYCDGQGVPEDLHAVTGECLVDLVLNHNDAAFKE